MPSKWFGRPGFNIYGLILCASFKTAPGIGSPSPRKWATSIPMRSSTLLQLASKTDAPVYLWNVILISLNPCESQQTLICLSGGWPSILVIMYWSTEGPGLMALNSPLYIVALGSRKNAFSLAESFISGQVSCFGECSERQMCESIPHAINESFMGVVSIKASTYSQLRKGWPVNEYMTYWMRAVESYSNGHLTLISDKMIAISGLARKLQAASEGNLCMYLAGLWRENLVLQLTWYVKKLGKKSKPSSYRCPSWAWLSTDSAVGFLGPRTDHGIDVLASISECITLFPSGDEYGLLRGGHLRIMCQLFCVELVDYQENDTAEEDDSWWLCPGGRVNILLDFLTDARDGVGALTTSTLVGTAQETIWWRLARPLDTQNNQLELFYLAVIKQMGDSLQGLVLRPTTSSDGTFQRFGAFIWNTSGKYQQLNMDELKTVTQDLPIPLCGTRKSDGRYEITIV